MIPNFNIFIFKIKIYFLVHKAKKNKKKTYLDIIMKIMKLSFLA